MSELDEIVAEFLAESADNLDQLDRDLVALEREPSSRPLLGSIFRTIHTIKGTTGFLDFHHLGELTHAGESLLSQLRDGLLVLTPEITDGLLALVDAVRASLGTIAETGREGSADHREVIATLSDLQQSQQDDGTGPAAERTGRPAPPRLGELMLGQGQVTPDDVSLAALAQSIGDRRPIGQILLSQGSASPEDVEAALSAQAAQADRGEDVRSAAVRVEVGLLDELMRLVGELVLTRNQLLTATGTSAQGELAHTCARLDALTGELQDGVMRTRMQPVDAVLSKLPRLVRDVAATCGKNVELVMTGRSTALDKTVLDAVRDPLTHLVRNAVDHGIESPPARRAAGKPEQGRLALRAFHAGGQVVVEVADDGAGIDPVRLAATAAERGLVDADRLAGMSDTDLLELVFLPGFSTASEVTSVSGRGVGMDVVRANVEAVGGSVAVSSTPGVGTTFRVTIPLTLAIIPALLVHCAGERYAVPQASLVKLVRLAGGTTSAALAGIGGAPVYRMDGRLLPLVQLDEVLGLRPGRRLGAAGGTSSDSLLHIAVLDVEGTRFGLVVDDVLTAQEVVVKPLGRRLAAVSGYAGATILGDGRVALILDVLSLAQRAQVVGTQTRGPVRPGQSPGAAGTGADAVAATAPAGEIELLVARLPDGRRVALPLSDVARLEQLPAARVERVGGAQVVQYRDDVLPLVHLGDPAGMPPGGPAADRPLLPVVVCRHGPVGTGLVVDAVLDIATGTRAAAGDGLPGVAGTVLVGGLLTELLDVDRLAALTGPAVGLAPVAP